MRKIARIWSVCFVFLFNPFLMGKEEKPTMKSDYSIYRPYVNKIIGQLAREMAEKYDIYCNGEGGTMHEKAKLISVSFTGNRRATLEEARGLEVCVVERLLELVNAHEKLRPYLVTFPFTAKHLDVSISFANGESYCDGTIALTGSSHGQLYYCSRDVINSKFINLPREPYEDAFKIVSQQPECRWTHQEKPYEKELDTVMESFAKEMRKKFKLQLDGYGGQSADGIDKVAFVFISRKKIPFEKAREMEVSMIERLLHMINSNEILKPYLKHCPFTAEDLEIKVDFLDKNDFHYLDAPVSSMYQKMGRVYYFREYSTEKGSVFLERWPLRDESYEEALKAATKGKKK